MKILYPIEGDGGGAVTHVLDLARHLPREGFTPLIVFLVDGASVQVARERGLEAVVMPKKHGLNLSLVWKLAEVMRTEKIDIVHTHTIRGNFYGRMAALVSRKPVVITTVHSFIVDELRGAKDAGLKDWMLMKREVLTAGLVDRFIAVSEKIKSKMVQNGMSERDIVVIENGVELPDPADAGVHRREVRDEFGVRDEEVIIGAVGRMVEVKNHELLLRAARKVVEKAPQARFFLVGDGVLGDHLRGLAAELGIEDRVVFTGWRNDVPRLMDAFDIYAISSHIEGLNISVLEAMAGAKPVVGTDVKGIADLVEHNETGLLVPPDDASAFAGAMERLVIDREESIRMGARGRRRVEEKYTVDRWVQRTADIYEKTYSGTLANA